MSEAKTNGINSNINARAKNGFRIKILVARQAAMESDQKRWENKPNEWYY